MTEGTEVGAFEKAVEAAAKEIMRVADQQASAPRVRERRGDQDHKRGGCFHEQARAALTAALPLITGREWRGMESAPKDEPYEFFFVRPTGTHPGTGKRFLPSIVQRIDGKLYAPDNEIEPLYFGEDEPVGHPLRQTLEWHPIPAEWLDTAGATLLAEERADG